MGGFALNLAPGPSTVHLQGFTSPDPGFGGFAPTSGKTVSVLGGGASGGRLVIGGPLTGGPGSTTVFGTVMGANPSGSLANSLMPDDCPAQSLQGRTNRILAASETATVTLIVDGTDTLSSRPGTPRAPAGAPS